jgi:hypothetical protein
MKQISCKSCGASFVCNNGMWSATCDCSDGSVEICEALIRHVEMTGSEIFGKNFIKEGKAICSVWCIVGPNADKFNQMVKEWLNKEGFK